MTGDVVSLNEPEEEESQSSRAVLCALGGACFGALPGAIIACFAPVRVGLAVALIGMPVGVVLAFGYAAPGRLSKLLLAVLVVYNVPPLEKSAYEWVDENGGPDEESSNASDRLLQWIIAEGTGKRRGVWVLLALLAGVIAGGALTARDVAEVPRGNQGLFLPLAGAKDSLATQAVIVTFCIGIWAGAAMGVVVSSAYRRPVLFAATIAGYLSGCIALAAAMIAAPVRSSSDSRLSQWESPCSSPHW